MSLNVQNGTVSRQGSGVHLENPEFQTRWYFKYFLGKGSMMFLFSLNFLPQLWPSQGSLMSNSWIMLIWKLLWKAWVINERLLIADENTYCYMFGSTASIMFQNTVLKNVQKDVIDSEFF